DLLAERSGIKTILYAVWSSEWEGFLFSLTGIGIGLFVFIIPYIMGGMGAGDAKLMAAVGAFLGPKGVLISAVLAIFAGLIYAIALLAVHPYYRRPFFSRSWLTVKAFFLTHQFIPILPEKEEKKPVLRFALPIALGTFSYLYLKATENGLIQNLLGINFDI
ncbi:MAG: A24 family peptidase, partial [Desulfobacterales bacterium]